MAVVMTAREPRSTAAAPASKQTRRKAGTQSLRPPSHETAGLPASPSITRVSSCASLALACRFREACESTTIFARMDLCDQRCCPPLRRGLVYHNRAHGTEDFLGGTPQTHDLGSPAKSDTAGQPYSFMPSVTVSYGRTQAFALGVRAWRT
jgi:hypothetical protein